MNTEAPTHLLREGPSGIREWNDWYASNSDAHILIAGNYQECDLRGIDLRWANAEAADFCNANLQDANLENASLHYLRGSNMHGANLRSAGIGSRMGADVRNAVLTEACLQNASFFKNARLSGADLSGSKLHGAVLFAADLTSAKLVGADLTHVNLGKAKISGADLSGAVLFETDLREASLTDANFDEANLTGAQLNTATVSKCSFRKANMTGVILRKATVNESDLGSALLEKSNLYQARILRCDVSESNFYDAIVQDLHFYANSGTPRKSTRLRLGEQGQIPLTGEKASKFFEDQFPRDDLQERINELESFLNRAKGRGKVFLSHSSADKPIVEKINIGLQERGIPTWYDKDRIDVGDPILQSISEGLDSSVFVAVFLSRASVDSKWVQDEMRLAYESVRTDRSKFLPILLEDIAIPSYLKGLTWADLRVHREDRIENVLDDLERAVSRWDNR